MIKEVSNYNGDVIKFAGDALQVIWRNRPNEPQESLAELVIRASRCCLAMLAKHSNFKPRTTDGAVLEGIVLKLHMGVGAGRISSFIVGGHGPSLDEKKWEYFIAGELPATVGGDRAATSPTYAQTNELNVSLAEAFDAGVATKGCGYCVTKEEDDTTYCTITVKLTALPRFPVDFTASVVNTSDELASSARYEGKLVQDDGTIVTTATYTIAPEEWDSGVTITVVGVDDAYYEQVVYNATNGEVPYTIELLNFSSSDGSRSEGTAIMMSASSDAHASTDFSRETIQWSSDVSTAGKVASTLNFHPQSFTDPSVWK